MTKQDIKNIFGIIGALIGVTVLIGTIGFMIYIFVKFTNDGIIL